MLWQRNWSGPDINRDVATCQEVEALLIFKFEGISMISIKMRRNIFDKFFLKMAAFRWVSYIWECNSCDTSNLVQSGLVLILHYFYSSSNASPLLEYLQIYNKASPYQFFFNPSDKPQTEYVCLVCDLWHQAPLHFFLDGAFMHDPT